MQLRKTCNHPWLFDWPVDSRTGEQLINEDLINASGKMLMLNQLLTALFAKGHKVLLFSQFTSMLDIVQDWAQEYKGWNMYGPFQSMRGLLALTSIHLDAGWMAPRSKRIAGSR